MIFLDTHIVVWLYAGLTTKLTDKAVSLIENNDVAISHMVRLELQYLFEIGRITTQPVEMITSLNRSIGLTINEMVADDVFTQALTVTWTRDVFDRIITAEAAVMNSALISKDKMILDNYPYAVWN